MSGRCQIAHALLTCAVQELVDEIRLFETGATGGRPVLVTHKVTKSALICHGRWDMSVLLKSHSN